MISADAIAAALQDALTVHQLHAMHGSGRLLHTLAAAHLRTAVASNALASALRITLASCGLERFFPVQISAKTSVLFRPTPTCTDERGTSLASIRPTRSRSRTLPPPLGLLGLLV